MKISTKRPFLWLGGAIVAAILVVDWFNFSFYSWLIFITAITLIGILIYRRVAVDKILDRTDYFLIILAILAIFSAGWRYMSVQPEHSPLFIHWYNDSDQKATLIGWIKTYPDERDTFTNLHIELTKVSIDNLEQDVQGLVLVRVPPNVHYTVGDVIQVQGYLFTPYEGDSFSYKNYLARQGIHSFMSTSNIDILSSHVGSPYLRITNQIREKLHSTIQILFPEPESSLLSGILLGIDKGIPPATQDAFRNTGTTHIIAISGFNITILAGLFSSIFRRWFGRWKGALAAAIGIGFYTVLVGAEASVIRAAIMGGTALFSAQLGRRQNGLNTLGFVAGVMCFFNPFLPWDVGFQLSFAATLGLILYAQPMQDAAIRWLSKRYDLEKAQKLAAPFAEYILFTIAAQVTTLPLIAFHFKQISLISFLVNPLILPAQPPVMIISGLAAILGAFYLPLGKLIAWLAWPFSMYTIRVVELFDKIPHAIIHLGEFSFMVVVLSYFVLFFFTLAPMEIKDRVRVKLKPAALLTVLTLVAVIVWQMAFSLPDGNLHITFLEAGDGNAIYVQTPSGKKILINGGPSRSVLADSLGRRFPLFNRHLDALIIGSTRETQLTSLPGLVSQFPPDLVLWSGNVGASNSAQQLNSRLLISGVEITQAEIGMVVDLGDGSLMEVLTINDNGMILLLTFGDFLALLPLEMDFDDLDELMQNPNLEKISVYLLPALVNSSLNPPEWMEKLSPSLVVLSASSTRPDGLFDSLPLYNQDQLVFLRTDHNGWIRISTDGLQMWAESEY